MQRCMQCDGVALPELLMCRLLSPGGGGRGMIIMINFISAWVLLVVVMGTDTGC